MYAPDKDGYTPIHLATEDGKNDYVPIVQILAPLAANLNACDRKGLTPIFYAVQNSCVDIIRILAPLTDNPNIQQDITGPTPIHIAAARLKVKIRH